jgi:hypothetical protein
MNLVIICTTIVLIFNILSDVFLFLNIYLIISTWQMSYYCYSADVSILNIYLFILGTTIIVLIFNVLL